MFEDKLCGNKAVLIEKCIPSCNLALAEYISICRIMNYYMLAERGKKMAIFNIGCRTPNAENLYMP